MSTTLVRIKFGSHLYGTSTPQSDLDYKSVFVPSARDILLQRVRATITNQRPKLEGEKNYAGEVDEEAYSLQRFLGLAAEGQTVALDMLFAPEWALEMPRSSTWQAIMINRHRLLSRRSGAFLGYCRQQANKYGIKGSRVATARVALEILGAALDRLGTTAKLGEIEDEISAAVGAHEHMALLDIEGATDVHGNRLRVRHWEVCNRKMPLTQTIKSAHEVMRRIVSEYGKRSMLAETNQGVDWKALSHAVRVGRQGLELWETGNITFPRPEAEHLLAIKRGDITYRAVADEIEELLDLMERRAVESALPLEPDLAWIDDFVIRVYGWQAMRILQ